MLVRRLNALLAVRVVKIASAVGFPVFFRKW